jgi:hypothetical protein
MAKSRIDNFTCPGCGEVIRQVVAVDGIVQGWCRKANKEIRVVVEAPIEEKAAEEQVIAAPLSYLDSLKQKREKVLKDMVSAREDGDLKENSAYLAARDQLTALDYRISVEQEKQRKSKADN